MFRFETDEIVQFDILAEAKEFIGITSSAEDATILIFVAAAAGKAEMLCNNLFRTQKVKLVTDASDMFLPGKISPDTLNVVDARTGSDVAFENIGNYVKHDSLQPVIVTYTTVEWLPDAVKQYILQAAAEMYSRGGEKIAVADEGLLVNYKIIAIC